MKTLYMADLDGTILPQGDEIPDRTAVIINALIKHGLNFTVNTSRTPQSAEPPLKKLNLKLPAILMNGACFYDFSAKLATDIFYIDVSVAQKVLDIIEKYPCNPFVFNADGNDVFANYTRCVSEAEKEFVKKRKNYYKKFVQSDKFILSDKVAYIICVGNRELLSGINSELKSLDGVSSSFFITDNGDGCYLEIYAFSAGKANAAKRFKEKYGFDRIVAFGDNLNDIEMLSFANTGVAVANAKDELKKSADIVIGSCEENAVADYLMVEWSRQPDLI